MVDVAREMIDARQAASLTQGDIAARMGTSQSAVAHLESARHANLCTVARYAVAIDRRIDSHLVPAESGREVLALAFGHRRRR
jgi:transcriptional regulator with XRE-family HTH domain